MVAPTSSGTATEPKPNGARKYHATSRTHPETRIVIEPSCHPDMLASATWKTSHGAAPSRAATSRLTPMPHSPEPTTRSTSRMTTRRPRPLRATAGEVTIRCYDCTVVRW